MSRTTTNPLLFVPTALAAVTVTSQNGVVYGNGAWVELMPSTPAGMYAAGLAYLFMGSKYTAEVDLGAGAAGAEAVIGTLRFSATTTLNGCPSLVLWPSAWKIPAGVRLTIRHRLSGSTATSFDYRLAYITNPDTDKVTTTQPFAMPAAATLNLTPPAADWSNGSWVEVDPGRADAYCVAGLVVPGPVAGTSPSDDEIDLGIGAVGVEVLATTFKETAVYTGNCGQSSVLPAFRSVPANTRIALRIRAGASVVARPVGLLAYGPEAPPAPAATEIEFDPDQDVSGETIGLAWIEHRDNAGALHVSSKIPLPDPASYYGGWKEPDITAWGTIRRALSDWKREFQNATFTWTHSDTDRVWRGLLAADGTRMMLNDAVVIRMIADASRRALALARTIVRGFIRSYKPGPRLTFQFTAADWLLRIITTDIPQRRLSRTYFPDLPTDAIDKPEPIIYGEMSDEGSATAPPVLTGDAARGAFLDSEWVCGYGNLTSGAAVPTNPTATVAAGGALSLDVPNSEYGVMITAVDGNGLESDPVPFFTGVSGGGGRGSFPVTVPHDTVSAGTQTINVAWTASAGAVKYRVYFGWYYYGFRPTQMIEVNAPAVACAFTANPEWTAALTVDNITPGATLIGWSTIGYYAVTAIAVDGETAMSATCAEVTRGYRRPVRVQWLAAAGALSYRVYRRPPGSPDGWDRMWTVPAGTLLLDDDWLDTSCTMVTGAPSATGVVPVRHVGSENVGGGIYQAFLVASHACASIISCFQNKLRLDPGCYGVTWLVPGKAGWPWGATRYRDLNGRRYTLLYVRGPDGDDAASGTRPITVNVQGIEDVGDGSGALITSVLQQYKHFLKNFAFGDWQTDAWLEAPVFPADPAPEASDTIRIMDDGSFDAADAVSAARVAGGYLGATLIGASDVLALREMITRWNRSCDVDCGFNRRTQFSVWMESDDAALLAGARHYTQERDIFADSFTIEDLDTELFNAQPYAFGFKPVDGSWAAVDNTTDLTSIADLEETRTAERLDLYMVPKQCVAVAHDIAAHALMRTAYPPREATWTTGLGGLSDELGNIVRVTHSDGIGAGGWVRHPVRVHVHEVDVEQFAVTLKARDVAYTFRRQTDTTWFAPSQTSDGAGGSRAVIDSVVAALGVNGRAGGSCVVGPLE